MLCHRLLLVAGVIVTFFAPSISANAQESEPREVDSLSVMAWNIWHGGKEDGETVGPQRVVEIIRNSSADVVAMQETYGSGELISEALGFHFHPRGTNVSIHSRYPVIEDISVFEEFKCAGALIELPDKRRVAFYSIWLPYNEEIWVEGTRDVANLESMKHACQASCDDLRTILGEINRRLDAQEYEGVPVIIAGDFNSMSHLDYISSFKDQFDGVVMDWSTSHVLIDAGFRDSWRELHPEVDRMIDRTWTPRFPEQQQDRIDYVYYRGSNLEATASRVIDTFINDSKDDWFPSDHAALISEFHWPLNLNQDRVRVASYNIKHGYGNDGELDLSRTAALVNNLNADIVGLQEVDNQASRSGGVDQAKFLGERTGLHSAFGSFMEFQGGNYGLAILSTYPIESSEEIRLPDGNEPRVALACRIKLPSGEFITAVNVHFDWVDDDKFRFAQAEKLAAYLETLETPYLLFGDFNDESGSRTLELLSKGALAAEKTATDSMTFSAVDPQREIDFIFGSPAVQWQLNWCKVLDGKVTSDHRPVIAVLELVDPTEPDGTEPGDKPGDVGSGGR